MFGRFVSFFVLIGFTSCSGGSWPYPLKQDPLGGPNVCFPESDRPCCEGWMQEYRHGPCVKPLCSPPCKGGVCIAPNMCQCRDGRTSRQCSHTAPTRRRCRRLHNGLMYGCGKSNIEISPVPCTGGNCRPCIGIDCTRRTYTGQNHHNRLYERYRDTSGNSNTHHKSPNRIQNNKKNYAIEKNRNLKPDSNYQNDRQEYRPERTSSFERSQIAENINYKRPHSNINRYNNRNVSNRLNTARKYRTRKPEVVYPLRNDISHNVHKTQRNTPLNDKETSSNDNSYTERTWSYLKSYRMKRPSTTLLKNIVNPYEVPNYQGHLQAMNSEKESENSKNSAYLTHAPTQISRSYNQPDSIPDNAAVDLTLLNPYKIEKSESSERNLNRPHRRYNYHQRTARLRQNNRNEYIVNPYSEMTQSNDFISSRGKYNKRPSVLSAFEKRPDIIKQRDDTYRPTTTNHDTSRGNLVNQNPKTGIYSNTNVERKEQGYPSRDSGKLRPRTGGAGNLINPSFSWPCHVGRCYTDKDRMTDIHIGRNYGGCGGVRCGIPQSRIIQVITSSSSIPCRNGLCNRNNNRVGTSNDKRRPIKSCVMPFCDLTNPFNHRDSIINDQIIECQQEMGPCDPSTGCNNSNGCKGIRLPSRCSGNGCSQDIPSMSNCGGNPVGCDPDPTLDTGCGDRPCQQEELIIEDNPCAEGQIFVEDPNGFRTCKDMDKFFEENMQ